MDTDSERKGEMCNLLIDAFGISLSMEDYRSIVTPGHATRIVLSKIDADGRGPRLREVAVDAIGKRLVELGHAEAVEEVTDLGKVLARPYAEPWERLGRAFGVKLPPLVPPTWIGCFAFFAWILFVGVLIAARIWFDLPIWAFLTSIAVSGVFALLIPARIRRELPDQWRTVGALADHLVFTHHEELNGGDPSWSEEQVVEAIELIAKRCYELDTVGPDTPLPG